MVQGVTTLITALSALVTKTKKLWLRLHKIELYYHIQVVKKHIYFFHGLKLKHALKGPILKLFSPKKDIKVLKEKLVFVFIKH